MVVQISADSLEGPPGGSRAAAAPAASQGKAKAAAPAGGVTSAPSRQPRHRPRRGARPRRRGVPLALQGLDQQGSAAGRRRDHVEGKKRLWNGIFRSGKEGHELVTDLEWEPFKAKYEQLQDKGLKLVDLETYVEGKKRLFAALYRETPDAGSLWVGEEEKVFTNKVDEFTGQGLRLIDVEAYRSGNKLLSRRVLEGHRQLRAVERHGMAGSGRPRPTTPPARASGWPTSSPTRTARSASTSGSSVAARQERAGGRPGVGGLREPLEGARRQGPAAGRPGVAARVAGAGGRCQVALFRASISTLAYGVPCDIGTASTWKPRSASRRCQSARLR